MWIVVESKVLARGRSVAAFELDDIYLASVSIKDVPLNTKGRLTRSCAR